MMAKVRTDNEVSQMIDIMARLRISKKYLIIATPELTRTALQNKTINLNVLIHHNKTGITIV